MECPYLEAWEVVAPVPLRVFCELFVGSLPLLPFEYEADGPHEWGLAIVENTPFEMFVQRWHDNGEPAFDEPFTVMLTPQHERQEEFPITPELRTQATPWIAKINETLNKTGREKKYADLQEDSQTSLAFWDNSVDDETWNGF